MTELGKIACAKSFIETLAKLKEKGYAPISSLRQ